MLVFNNNILEIESFLKIGQKTKYVIFDKNYAFITIFGQYYE